MGQKPAQLAGGKHHSIAIGKAPVRDSELFLFDEPLSNLTAERHTKMRAEIKLLHQEPGTTFIYVAQDQIEAMTMASHGAVMRDGRILQVGRPQAV